MPFLAWLVLLLGCSPFTVKFPLTEEEAAASDLDGDGYSPNAGDCDDNDSASYPGAATYCDGDALIDRDCDGDPDADACDLDGDGWSPDDGDCNDGDASSYPDVSEYCGDPGAVDNDCDGAGDATDPDCADTGTA